MPISKSQEFKERQIELNGWTVKLTNYRVGDKYICQAYNGVGACLARFSAASAQAAESQAVSKAQHLLGKTHRRGV